MQLAPAKVNSRNALVPYMGCVKLLSKQVWFSYLLQQRVQKWTCCYGHVAAANMWIIPACSV